MTALDQFQDIETALAGWSRSWAEDYGSDEDDSGSPPRLFQLPDMPASLGMPTAPALIQVPEEDASPPGTIVPVSSAVPAALELRPSSLFSMHAPAVGGALANRPVHSHTLIQGVVTYHAQRTQAAAEQGGTHRTAAVFSPAASLALLQDAVVQTILEALLGRVHGGLWSTPVDTGTTLAPAADTLSRLAECVDLAAATSLRALSTRDAFLPLSLCATHISQGRRASFSIRTGLEWATQCLNDLRYAKWYATSVLSWSFNASALARLHEIQASSSCNPALVSLLTHMQACHTEERAVAAVPPLNALFGPTVAVMARFLLEAVESLEVAISSALSYTRQPRAAADGSPPPLTLTTLRLWIDRYREQIQRLVSMLETALEPSGLVASAASLSAPLDRTRGGHSPTVQSVMAMIEACDALPAVAATRVLHAVALAADVGSSHESVGERTVSIAASGPASFGLDHLVEPLPAVKVLAADLPQPAGWQMTLSRLLDTLLQTYVNNLQFAVLGPSRAPWLLEGTSVPFTHALAEVPFRPPSHTSHLLLLAERIAEGSFWQDLVHGSLLDLPELTLQFTSPGRAAQVLYDVVPSLLCTPGYTAESSGLMLDLASIPGQLAAASDRVVRSWLESVPEDLARALDVQATRIASLPVFRSAYVPPAHADAQKGGRAKETIPERATEVMPFVPADPPLQPQQLKYPADERIGNRHGSATISIQGRQDIVMQPAQAVGELSTDVVKTKPVFGPGYAPAQGTIRSAWWDIDAQQEVKKEADAGSATALAPSAVLQSSFGSLHRAPSAGALAAIDEEEEAEHGDVQHAQGTAHDDDDDQEEQTGVVDWTEDGELINQGTASCPPEEVISLSDAENEQGQEMNAHQEEPPLRASGFFPDLASRLDAAATTADGHVGRHIPIRFPWEDPFHAWDWLASGQKEHEGVDGEASAGLRRGLVAGSRDGTVIEPVSSSMTKSILAMLAAHANLCGSLAVHVLLSQDGCKGRECLQALRDVALGTSGPLLYRFTHGLFESLERPATATDVDMSSLARMVRGKSSAALTVLLRESISDRSGALFSVLSAHAVRFEVTFLGSGSSRQGTGMGQPPEQWLRDELALSYDCGARLAGTDNPAPFAEELLSAYLLPPSHLSAYSSLFTHLVLYLGYAEFKVQSVTKAASRAHEFVQKLLGDLCWSRTAGLPESLLRQLPQLEKVCTLLPILQQGRHIALQLVTATRQHISTQVTGMPWAVLESSLASARSCEQVRACHDAYMRTISRAALLGTGQEAPKAALHGLIGRALNLCRQIEAAYIVCVQQLESVRTAIEDDVNAEVLLYDAGEGDILGQEAFPRRKRTKAYREGHLLHSSTVDECTMPLLAVARQLADVQSALQSLKKHAALAVMAGRVAGSAMGGAADAARSTGLEALLALVDFNGYFQRL